MKSPVRRRQLRGLVLHHRRHPSEHPRRLVNRTALWGEPPVSGICRWCYEPAAILRAFTPDNLRWLCRSCHRRKTRQDRLLAKFVTACSLDWRGARRLLRRNRRWALSFLLPGSLELDVSNAASPSSAGAQAAL